MDSVPASADSVRARAPGRLDLLGGVADYSGALVLEVPTHRSTEVVATPHTAYGVGPVEMTADDMADLARLGYPEVRRALAPFPRWTHYVIGVALLLLRQGIVPVKPVRFDITSDVPASVGVASSAALEVAVARALAPDLDPLRLAALCQEAENHVVGAPCGIMDQVAVAAGRPGWLLPVLCRPASLQPTVPLAPELDVVGWPTGTEHEVSGLPYRRARVAAFMGKRIVELAGGRSWSWISELPALEVARLPDALDGSAFLNRWEVIGDELTSVDPDECYPVRAATTFGVEEHERSARALDALKCGDPAALGPLMRASDAAYTAMGLGHPAAAAVAEEALARPGVFGARSSGGGCGGTVVVACRPGALDDVDGLIR
jgi:L-arabinokinase